MAQSRLERIGSIFSRVTSLVRGGTMLEEDKPVWYKIYAAFPPKYEPRFDREVPATPIRNLYYQEDIVRAKLQRNHDAQLVYDLRNEKAPSLVKQFIKTHEGYRKEGLSDNDAYRQTMKQMKHELTQESRKSAQQPDVVVEEKETTYSIDTGVLFADDSGEPKENAR